MGVARRLTPILQCPRWLSWLKFVPGLAWLRWVVVLRYDEVREVLSHSRGFPCRMGSPDDRGHAGTELRAGHAAGQGLRAQLRAACQGIPARGGAHAYRKSVGHDCRAHSRGQGNAGIRRRREVDHCSSDSNSCESYFGLQIADKELFAKWTLAISAYLFGPSSDATGTALARAAAENLRNVIRASIANARTKSLSWNTALKNLIDMSNEAGSRVTDDVSSGSCSGW